MLLPKRNMRGNSKPFMAKTLSKEIMKRTRLKNRFLKNPNAVKKRKQAIFCEPQ